MVCFRVAPRYALALSSVASSSAVAVMGARSSAAKSLWWGSLKSLPPSAAMIERRMSDL